MMNRRYTKIFKCINACKPKRIIEIGTWDGRHAEEMIQLAKQLSPNEEIYYLGFDLFEDFTVSKEEYCPKKPAICDEVSARLIKYGNVQLYKGNTKQILPNFRIHDVDDYLPGDFIFIDGGHSLDTVKNDWENCRDKFSHGKTVFLFDDYYHDTTIAQKFGCRSLIDSLDPSLFKVTHFTNAVDACNGGTSVVKVEFR